jgi:hypothetical protein
MPKSEGTGVLGCYIVSTVNKTFRYHFLIHRSIVPPSSGSIVQNYIIFQQNSIPVDIATRNSNHAIQKL